MTLLAKQRDASAEHARRATAGRPGEVRPDTLSRRTEPDGGLGRDGLAALRATLDRSPGVEAQRRLQREQDRGRPGPGPHVVQREWEPEDELTDRWDALLDGVRWHADRKTGLMWFDVSAKDAIREGRPEDYARLAGPKHQRTWQEWNLVSVRPVTRRPQDVFAPNVRQAQWGQVYEVAPGIGVEVQQGEDPGYADFVARQLGIATRTLTGQRLVAQFDPLGVGSTFRQVEDQQGPYQGLTVIVGRPQQKTQSGRAIKTEELGGRRPNGLPSFGQPSIPRLNFFGPSDPPEQVGTTDAYATTRGVEHHKDFPDSVQSFDIVLFHELIHAYLSQLGIGRRLREVGDNINKLPGLTGEADTIEERLVVGIHGGLGLPFAENTQRRAQGYEPRPAYRSVGLEADERLERWLAEGVDPTSIYDALIGAGLSHAQALFVVGGPKVKG